MDRKLFLDKLRIAATCAVVLLHTVTGVMDTTDISGYPMEKTLFLILLDWLTWCVPIFVLISGYLFLNPDRNFSFRQMLTKYCRRIIFALFFFGVPYACMELVMTGYPITVKMVGKAVLMVCTGKSWAHMWYLYLVLVLYLVTSLLKRVLQMIPRWVLYGILDFLVLGSSIFPFFNKLIGREQLPVLPDGGIYLFYYLCGYLFAVEEKKEQDGKRSARLLVIAGLFAGMMCSRLFGDYSVQMAYNYPFTVLVSLLFMQLACRREQVMETPAVTAVSRLCFGIYLVHPVFLNVLYKLFGISLLDFPVWVSLPGIFLAVLLLSGIVAWVLYQIPVLRKYVL